MAIISSLYGAAAGFNPPTPAIGLLGVASGNVIILTGSSTKIVRVGRLRLLGTSINSPSVTVLVTLFKMSVPLVGGVGTHPLIVTFDSTDMPATAQLTYFDDNASPTGGSGISFGIQALDIIERSDTIGSPGKAGSIEFNLNRPLTIRGTSEQLVVSFSVATNAGSGEQTLWPMGYKFYFDILWEEANS